MVTPKQSDEEREIEALLRAAGRREQLPADLQSRWEQGFRAELELARARRRRRRLGWTAAAAAILAVVFIGLALGPTGSAPVSPEVRIAHVAGTARVDGASAEAGMKLVAGSRILTGDGAALGLDFAGYDLRLDADSELLVRGDGVTLQRGALYASDEGRHTVIPALTVQTPHGRVTDIGTQFMVRTESGSSTALVRRGRLRVVNDSGEVELASPPGAAGEVSFAATGALRPGEAAASGETWQWIHAGAAAFVLEGASARAFLDWQAAERGLVLTFDSVAAEVRAGTTTLHGELGHTGALPEPGPILRSVGLEAGVSGDGSLRVSLYRRPL